MKLVKSKFLIDLASVALSRGMVILLGVLKTIVIARYLGPENNGLIASLAVYPSLFMSFGSLGVSQSVTYFTGKDIFTDSQLKRSILQIWLFSSLLSLVVCYYLITTLDISSRALIVLSVAPIPFTLFINYVQGIFLGKNKIKEYNRINWIPPFIVLLTTWLLLHFLNMGVRGALIGAFLGPLVMSVLLFFYINFNIKNLFNVELAVIKKLLTLGLIYALSLLIINLNYKVDIVIMNRLSNNYEIGIYSKGAQLIEYLWQIPMLLSTIIFARSAIAKKSKEFSLKVILLLKVSFIILLFSCLFLYVFSDTLITFLFGQDFFDSSLVFQILIPGVVLLTIYKVLNMDLAGQGKPWVAIYSMLPALVINIVLNFIWVPEYGARGSALASTISYSIAAILFLLIYSKISKIPLRTFVTLTKDEINYFKQMFIK